MKISAKVREQAAMICAIAASNGAPISVTNVTSQLYGMPADEAVETDQAWLAVRAWAHAHRIRLGNFGADELRDDYAEAEALLRTGWTP